MSEKKKYELTDITMEYNGILLHRIRALKDFGNIKKGDLGGWIEKESNLSHNGKCWVYNNAKVYNNAIILDDATVFNNAMIYGDAVVQNKSIVSDCARIYDTALISGMSFVYHEVHVFGNAKVMNSSQICGYARVSQHAQIMGESTIDGVVYINGYAQIYDSDIHDSVKITDNAQIYNSTIRGNATLSIDCQIRCKSDYIVLPCYDDLEETSFITIYKTRYNTINVDLPRGSCSVVNLGGYLNFISSITDKRTKRMHMHILNIIEFNFNIKIRKINKLRLLLGRKVKCKK